jgi:hypothetical protein
MSNRLIIVDDNVGKFFIEYMSTFEEYTHVTKSSLRSYDLSNCTDIIAVQRGTWLPDNAFKPHIRIAVLNTEQLCDSDVIDRVCSELSQVEQRCGYKPDVYDYSQINCEILRKRGYNAVYYPYKTTDAEKEYLSSLAVKEKVYDVGFVGSLNARRRKIIDELTARGVRVCIVEYIYGQERDETISKCKLILNIHWESHYNIFETIRCKRWLDSGYTIITEDSVDTIESPNLHSYSYDSLVEGVISKLESCSYVSKIIGYIHNCIRPRGSFEFSEVNLFDYETYDKLVQDGFMVVNDKSTIPESLMTGHDMVDIANVCILRKNIPREIAWRSDEDGTLSFDSSTEPIYRRFIPPPIETVDHVFIISNIIAATNNGLNKSYVEYGVRSGTSIEAVSKYVKIAYGVDITNYTPTGTNIKFYKMFTDEFSTLQLPTIEYDYAFIDADHSSKQVLIDFEYVFAHLNKGGYIFLHDTYPCGEYLLRSDYCNDCYMTPLLIRKKYPNISMLTLPLNPGLTIVHKID